MARIRNIKPGFFKDSDLFDAEAAVGLPLRVAYAGLWTVADRAGRFKWKPREIKTDILPFDDLDMGAVMDALARYGFIARYKAEGGEYGYIPNFEKHQFINKNELASQLPDPAQNIIIDSVPNSEPTSSHSAPENYHVLLDTDTDGLTQTQVLESAPQAATSKPVQAKGTRWPADREVPVEWFKDIAEKFRGLGRAPPDFRIEAVKFANHWSAKTGKDGTKNDWKRTFENWCLNARSDDIVPFQSPALTPSERERVERLVWTHDRGRGWKNRPTTSSDLPYLLETQRALEGRQRPADRVAIVGSLARLANHFRNERPAEAWQMLFEDYASDLDGISEPHLNAIIDAARRENPWFPKSADLVDRWHAIQRLESERLRRVRVLQGLEQPKPWEAA